MRQWSRATLAAWLRDGSLDLPAYHLFCRNGELRLHRSHAGCPRGALRRYTPWGCIDLVSAESGQMEKRYGSICVGKDDQGVGDLRCETGDSFEWYQRVIASNGEAL